MRNPAPPVGPATGRLLRAVALGLLRRSLTDSLLLALASLLACAHLVAAGAALAPEPIASLAEAAARWMPVAAALAAGVALLPLALRPSRRYLAALVERSCPAMAGSLVLLAEGHRDLDPGVAALAAERADQAASGASVQAALRLAPRPRRGAAALTAALGLGLIGLFLGGGRYLDALARTAGLETAGPMRFAAVNPGDVEIEEGQALSASCRMSGRAPGMVKAVFDGGQGFELQPAEAGVWEGSGAPSGGHYWLEAEDRGMKLRSATYTVSVCPRPSARPVAVDYRYPAYTGLTPRSTDCAEVDCLQGTAIEVVVRTVGRVKEIALLLEPDGRRVPARRGTDGLWRAAFKAERSGSYTLLLRPAQGAEREEARAPITARRDLPPTAAAAVRELPDGRLVIDYRAGDDYRLGPTVMAITVGGRRSLYEVPDAAGSREAQGAVLVPREVLDAAGAGGFRYRLEVADTREPEPNRAVSDELEYRPVQQLASTGPLLEPPERRSPPPPSGPPSGGGTSVQTTRPLESLYKPETGKPKEEPPAGEPPPDDGKDPGEFLAPPGQEEGPSPPPKPAGQKNRPGEEGGEPPPDGGPENGREPENQTANVPQPTPAPGPGQSGNTPGQSTPQPRGPGSENGTEPGGERPPTGAETGTRQSLPEHVLPGHVNMELRPGEAIDPAAGRPAALPTGWGRAPGASGPGATSLPPGGISPPGGALRILRPGAGPAVDRPGPSGSAPIAPQYRRYVQEYLRALAEGER